MSSITIQDQRLSWATVLPDAFVDYYMPRANGEFVKIYLYLLRSVHAPGGGPSLSGLADVFSCTENDVLRALRYWEKAGLLSLTFENKELSAVRLLPLSLDATQKDTEETVPAQTSGGEAPVQEKAEISGERLRALKNNEEAKQILFFTEHYLGRPLSPTDMRRILYFYDTLHFTPDLIDYLVEYCVSLEKRSLSYIEHVGLEWHRDGIRTVREAKARTSTWMKSYYAVFRAFGIRNRNPIPEERQTMDRWLTEYRFPLEIIQEAAARTIAQTGTPSFRYAERILSDLHAAGVRTAEDISRLDAEHREKQAALQPAEDSASKGERTAAGSSTSQSGRPQAGSGRKGRRSNSFNDNFEPRDYDYDALEAALLKQQNSGKA